SVVTQFEPPQWDLARGRHGGDGQRRTADGGRGPNGGTPARSGALLPRRVPQLDVARRSLYWRERSIGHSAGSAESHAAEPAGRVRLLSIPAAVRSCADPQAGAS